MMERLQTEKTLFDRSIMNIFKQTADRFSSWPVLCILAISMMAAAVNPGSSYLKAANIPASGISIEKITIGEERIEAGRPQLIEVLIKNRTAKIVSATVKLSLILPNHNIITYGNKKVLLPAKSDHRALMSYPIDKNRGGDYTVSAKIHSSDNKVLAQSHENQKKYFFAVDSTRRNQKPNRPAKSAEKEKEEEKEAKETEVRKPVVHFDPPDLLIKNLQILHNNSILRGETAHIRFEIVNDGGDIATNIDYSVAWFFAPRPNLKNKAFVNQISMIAPGETKVIELPVTIPTTRQKGDYKITVAVDEANRIDEINEKNNTTTTNKSIVFSDIALVFPEDGHSFAEDGLFKFEWRSRRYTQFKVQISVSAMFTHSEEIFELPKGSGEEGWTPANIIKPLAGEMPAMALALMESYGTDHLFWRVRAKDSEGGTTESEARKFFINLKADLQ